MMTVTQSPTDSAFVQNPYPFYAEHRAKAPLHVWADYNMPAAFSHDAVQALLRDRRFGREIPAELGAQRIVVDHVRVFEGRRLPAVLAVVCERLVGVGVAIAYDAA